MRPAQSHLALRSVALFVLMFSSSRYLGTALNYQLKNATSSRHRLFSRRHLNSVANSNTNVESQTYTQTVIANFMKSLPPLGTAEVIRILEASIEQHKVLPNVIRLKVPVINRPAVTGLDVALTEISSYTEGTPEIQYGNFSICGDTHGQFFDVMNIFSDKVGGFPTRSNAYLFNGDFVDRGMYSIEVILTLLAIKLSDPTAMNLLRGNHETILMNDMFGFTKEVKTKYPNDHKILLPLFQILFCSLPIAAVVENQGTVQYHSDIFRFHHFFHHWHQIMPCVYFPSCRSGNLSFADTALHKQFL